MYSEIPKSRINITLELDQNGETRRKELPLKLLFLGDFSLAKQHTPLFKRQRHTIHKVNFDDVLKQFHPTLNFQVKNIVNPSHENLSISLEFNKLKDFLPESIAMQIPELQQLIAMRNLLKDLRALSLDNPNFRKQLKEFMTEKNQLSQMIQVLEQQAPLNRSIKRKSEDAR